MMSPEAAEFGILCRKVGFALLRAVFLAVFMGVHFLLNKLLSLVVPPSMSRFLELSQIVIGIMFLFVYLYLGWDMVTVFMPRWNRPAERVDAVSKEEKK